MDKMEQKREAKRVLYKKWNNFGTVAGIILFVLAYTFQDVPWLMHSPGLRILLHAIAAVAAVFGFYFTFVRFMVFITQLLLEPWILIVTDDNHLVYVLRTIIAISRPIIAARIYIAYAYRWELSQAVNLGRPIQEEQLMVVIMFTILACKCMYKFTNCAAIYPEECNQKYKLEIQDSYYDMVEYWALKYKNGGVIFNFIYFLGIPTFTIICNYLAVWTIFRVTTAPY